MFGIVGGVLADTLDRRRLLIAVQSGLRWPVPRSPPSPSRVRCRPRSCSCSPSSSAAAPSWSNPPISHSSPSSCPATEIPAAVQLNSVNVNIARAVGPAVAGVLIVGIGVGAVFALNAATFLFYGLVVRFGGQLRALRPSSRSGSCRRLQGGWPLRPLRAGRPADLVSSGVVPPTGERPVGVTALGGKPAPGARAERLRAAARGARRGRRRGRLPPLEMACSAVSERHCRAGGRGLRRRPGGGGPAALHRSRS